MDCTRVSKWLACLLLTPLVGGCDLVPRPSGGSSAAPAESAPKPQASSDVESLEEGDVTRIYYQFVDDRRRVRFVTSLDLVPAEWRDRVGHVEMSVPPPMSPADMKRRIEAKAARSAQRVALQKRGPNIVIYSADWCPACVKAKRYMDGKGYSYEERNIDQPRYKEMLVKVSGGRSIPVIDIDGEIMKGFSPHRLEQMISEAS